MNPAVVTPSAAAAKAEEVATGFADSMTLGVGQFCTKPGLLFVPAGSALPALVATRLAAIAGAPMLNESIARGYAGALDELAGHEGVSVVAGGEGGDAPAPSLLTTSAAEFLKDPETLTHEAFGPAALVIEYADTAELQRAIGVIDGQLTATVQAVDDDPDAAAVLPLLAERAGRVLVNGWPTGVSVTWAMQHGGPYPATTSVQTTSVGTAAIDRFLRPVSYQGTPGRAAAGAAPRGQPVGPPPPRRRRPGALTRTSAAPSGAFWTTGPWSTQEPACRAIGLPEVRDLGRGQRPPATRRIAPVV